MRAAVTGGEYASNSEIVREALREWRQKRALRERELAELRADMDIDAGRVKDFDPERIIQEGGRKSAGRDPSA